MSQSKFLQYSPDLSHQKAQFREIEHNYSFPLVETSIRTFVSTSPPNPQFSMGSVPLAYSSHHRRSSFGPFSFTWF